MNLDRFLKAQERDYPIAYSELQAGQKRSHWMWYIFPQIVGLGHSITAKLYAIHNLDEANLYLQHPILGKRLIELSEVVYNLPTDKIDLIFPFPDNLKFHSCVTLFAQVVHEENSIFNKNLLKYFSGELDKETMKILATFNS